jgi:hypothetical protein
MTNTRTPSPERRHVVEARSCLENARRELRDLATLDDANASALYQMNAELQSVEAQLARFEQHYRQVTA